MLSKLPNGYHVSGAPVATPLRARSAYAGLSLECKSDDFIEVKTDALSLIATSKRSRGMRGEGKMTSSLPPVLSLFPSRRLRMLFRNSSGANSPSLTVGNILCAFGLIATGSTSAFSYHTAVRIKSFTIWPGLSATAGQVAQIFWVGSTGNVPDTERATDLPGGVSVTGAVKFVPPKGSLASFWWNSADAATSVVELEIPPQSILLADVELNQAVSQATVQYTSSGLTAGAAYYGKLDGSGGALAPVGVNVAG